MAAPSTRKEIRERVQVDLDLQEETFITDDEVNSWINDGIREAEAEIAGIGSEYHNYFLSKKVLDTITGRAEYLLPNNIYAHKMRAAIFNDGSNNIHKIRPIKDFEQIPFITQTGTTSPLYSYVLTHGTTGARLTLFPTPQATTTTGAITLWYIRNAAQLETDTDECDIPEFVNFIIWYVKVQCLKKEGNPNLGVAMADLEQQRKLMIDTLTTRVVDDENLIPPDISHYTDSMDVYWSY
jgi:hypothetical protein